MGGVGSKMSELIFLYYALLSWPFVANSLASGGYKHKAIYGLSVSKNLGQTSDIKNQSMLGPEH